MRWTVIIVMALASVGTAQQPSRTPPPSGVDISARDGDRIVLDDDARIQIVRRRQATIRTIYSQKERLLIVLVDYLKPGEFPDGMVDWAFNFYQVEGTWPLGPRWEALTSMFQYEGVGSRPRGLALETPRGLVQLVTRGPEAAEPDPRAIVVLSHGGSSSGPRRGLSFAEAEKAQLHDFARSKASGATVSTLMSPDGRVGTAVVTGGIRKGNSTAPEIQAVPPPYPDRTRPRVGTPPPVGEEIPASDGDRVIVDDDARVQIIRRREAMVRTIFSHEQRLLIVLADYAKPGQFPDGDVDTAFNFYEVLGDWPLAPRWEGLTTMFQYEGDLQFPRGYALATPQGIVHLSPGRPQGARQPDPAAIAVLWFRGSSIGQRRSLSFAEAEKLQLSEAARHRSAPAPPAP